MHELRGIMPALVTPFSRSNELDEDGFLWIVKNSLASGVHGLIVSGSLGEFPNLSDLERQKVIKIAVDEVNGKIPILAGVGSASTDHAVSLGKQAADCGADFALVLPPFYYQTQEEAVFKHYELIANSIDIPVVIYNFPGTTKINMSPPLVAKLAGLEGIVGIKNTVDSVVHFRELVRLTKPQKKSFAVLAGMEDYLIPALLLGGQGSVSGLGNFVPQVLVEIYNRVMDNRIREAADLFNRVIIPLKVLAPPPEPIGALKVGLKIVSGKTTTIVRPPLQSAPEGTETSMRSFLKEAGLIPAEVSA
jgi:4-hydroxy-tetrahydrodipicolinate synthase